MKISLITDGIVPYVSGGMQKHSYYLAKYFALNGIQVDLYHTQTNPEYDIETLEVFTPEEKKYINSIVVPFPPPGKIPGHYLRRSKKYSKGVLKAFLKQEPSDFVYVKGFAGWSLLKAKARGVITPPVAINFHGLNMYQKPANFRSKLEAIMFRPAVKFNLLNADYVFSYGGQITRILENIGIAAEHILEFPGGIDESWLDDRIEHHKIRRFLYVGRYERLKGIQEINQTVLELKGKYQFEFHCIGPIPDGLKLNESFVKYWGTNLPESKVKEIYKMCDVVLCPSHSEGMPNVLLEGFAQSLTAIGTKVGGIPAIIKNGNGWLIENPTVEDISNAMIDAINIDEDLLDKMKLQAYQDIKSNFLWPDLIGRKIQLIQNIISTH
ncbi:glycosyltransferase family 4 protein [Paracrocinitomix mangrovi]|uniref:glycosyltransferase family 4 protein n=1 Tax=Paracrocinitomix mangrovi TaxID=2862509 RepID=UPI001C8D5551|nr:glycosyltransferase family 4 protein [Paracrocinitomix mangrovi]UKN01719.1 glycosyltransferase family 4 protein [Paracrocinitomix mangrovi]